MTQTTGDNNADLLVADIRPLVANDTGNRPLWFGIAAIFLFGAMLFLMLEGRREKISAPATRLRSADLAVTPSSLPPLYIPPEPAAVPTVLPPKPSELPKTETVQRIGQPQFPPQRINQFPPTRITPDFSSAQPPQPRALPKPAVDASPAIVFDQTVGEEGGARTVAPSAQVAAPVTAIAARARAGRTRNKASIVPQGTLISAVLETALDSTQPGQARALVSRDVPNLAGPVLIPRGSRLYGEYKGELTAGQKRATVQWTRLETPDGATIAIDSPAADQLGRAGIKGRVNSQFAARFGGALLQSVIDVGAIAAAGAISNSRFFVPIPGAVQGSTSQLAVQPAKPTLRVRQGTRISVFVSRDLDFSAVSARQ
jgi:type IV secretion system protein VirB10